MKRSRIYRLYASERRVSELLLNNLRLLRVQHAAMLSSQQMTQFTSHSSTREICFKVLMLIDGQGPWP